MAPSMGPLSTLLNHCTIGMSILYLIKKMNDSLTKPNMTIISRHRKMRQSFHIHMVWLGVGVWCLGGREVYQRVSSL